VARSREDVTDVGEDDGDGHNDDNDDDGDDKDDDDNDEVNGDNETPSPFLPAHIDLPARSLPAASYSLGTTYSPAEDRSPAAPVSASSGNHHDDGDDGCGCGCDGGGGGGGGDSNNGPPRLKNTRVLAHSRPDDTMSRCCGTKIGAAGPHGVFRAARLTSRNPPHTTIDPNGGRTDVRTDGQAGRQARRNHG